jgi:hypothetical protein
MLQAVVSLTIIILMARGVNYAPRVINYAPRVIYLYLLLENKYSTVVTYDCHL